MFEGINNALMFLFEYKKINETQLKWLQYYYKGIVDSNNFNLNNVKDDLKRLFEDSNYVNVILLRISSNNSVNDSLNNKMDTVQNNYNKQTVEAINDVSNDKKNELIDVYDFRRENQDYIKLTYSDGSVRILENNLSHNGRDYKGEEIFDILKEKYKESDITRIMHEFTRNSIEVRLYDFKDLDNKNIYDDLSQNERQLISIVMSQYPDKKVLSGASNNMFVVQEFGKPDILVQVVSLNGVYQVRPIIGSIVNDEPKENISGKSNGVSNSKSIQKSLSTPIGRMFSDSRESGFMMLLLFIFLAGISSGIIFMIILNFIV